MSTPQDKADHATTANLATPGRALAIGAHPDDIEFGCGGTLAKWAAAGCEIAHLVCTDGSKGTWDPGEDPAALVLRRQGEQREAARALGGGTVVFLGWPDGELTSGLRQRIEIASWIRRLRPDVVLGHDPWKRYRLHPDHRHAGFLLTDGIVAARDPLFFPELNLAPHRPNTVLLFEAEEVDHLEDVTMSFEAKVAALLAHQSQLRSTMDISDPTADGGSEVTAFVARERARLEKAGARHDIALAEPFKRLERL